MRLHRGSRYPSSIEQKKPKHFDASYYGGHCPPEYIHHVRIQWEGHPLLLFSNPKMVASDYTTKFRDQASHITHQQHLQMGLRKGMAILVYYATHYQVVLLAHDSVLRKRVSPVVTEFAWLPPTIAESFCRKALYRDDARTYLPFDHPHLAFHQDPDLFKLLRLYKSWASYKSFQSSDGLQPRMFVCGSFFPLSSSHFIVLCISAALMEPLPLFWTRPDSFDASRQ